MDEVQKKLLEESRQLFPEAENDYVAVDLHAQKIYKGAIDLSVSEAEYNALGSKYRELCGLRKYLLETEIERESGIVHESAESKESVKSEVCDG
jgi:hypothetical protein